MKTLKILDWPEQKYYSESHPFYKWSNKLRESGINVEFFNDHLNKKIRNAEYLLIHSRYFANGWQNVEKRTSENEAELIAYLKMIRKTVDKIIWFDAADSSGSSDFAIIGLVDIFLKKQVLKDLSYYTDTKEEKDLRIWLNQDDQPVLTPFVPCPEEHLHKIRLGWNIGLNDYRYFGYKTSRLSNYLSYSLYPNKFSRVSKPRPYDLTFRGTVHRGTGVKEAVSYQRNTILEVLKEVNVAAATGSNIPKNHYWQEMRKSKLSVSPFGWGEICYRDFESFISGALLIKPSMEHLNTYPNVYIPYETYIPISWNLENIGWELEKLAENYLVFKHIAIEGQEIYKQAINDDGRFINTILNLLA